MATQPSTYFEDIYSNLKDSLSEFPSNDPSPNFQDCIISSNFVRAEGLAKEHNLPSDTISHLQELAVRQYILDYKNEAGLQKLAEVFNITQAELNRLIGLVVVPTKAKQSILSRFIAWLKRIFGKD